MQTCKHCGVAVTGSGRCCPLCQGTLAGTPSPEEDVFPVLTRSRQRLVLFLRICALATVAAAVICLAVNFMLPDDGWWSLFVVGGLGSVWLLGAIALCKRHNIPKTILWLVVLAGLLSLVWDHLTGGHGWAFRYVIPILCSGAMLTLLILPQILHMGVSDYLVYLVIDFLFAVLPVLFYFTGRLGTTLIPSLVCVCISLVSFTAVLVFQGRALAGELSRRMHI